MFIEQTNVTSSPNNRVGPIPTPSFRRRAHILTIDEVNQRNAVTFLRSHTSSARQTAGWQINLGRTEKASALLGPYKIPSAMHLNKIFLRYYPPGIALEYRTEEGECRLNHIDLLDLQPKTSVEQVMQTLAIDGAPALDKPTAKATHEQSAAIKQAIVKLQRKLREPRKKKFYLHKCLRSHILPLTNVCFDRRGERCLSGSYDRTCRVVNTHSGREEHVLSGHENVVFGVAFNYPNCDKVATASFDGTAKVWSSASGACLSTLSGHTAELVAAEFHPLHGAAIATASLDGSARIFHVESALEMQTVQCHGGAEVIAARYSRDGNLLLTGAFDHTAALWDTRAKCVAAQLRGHSAELSNCVWNFSGELIATSSLDSTARVWDVRRLDRCLHTISDHTDEVLDVAFDYAGKLLATASSDGTARVWSLRAPSNGGAGDGELTLVSLLAGHADEVSKVCFSPPGGLVLTASADRTARLWLTESGLCAQVLAGHESEVFSCAFSYAGDIVVTASKDNSCRLWR